LEGFPGQIAREIGELAEISLLLSVPGYFLSNTSCFDVLPVYFRPYQ
jgi:hypothetical protein